MVEEGIPIVVNFELIEKKILTEALTTFSNLNGQILCLLSEFLLKNNGFVYY